MKTSLRFLPFLICITFLFSCEKQETDHNGNDKLILNGTWKWVSTAGGIYYHVETPATTGKNINLALNSDSRYFIYTNGVLTSQGTFTLITQNCIHDHTNKKVIVFSSPGDRQMMIDKMDSHTLELFDNAYDGETSSYVKE
jgi:hypothetical protein